MSTTSITQNPRSVDANTMNEDMESGLSHSGSSSSDSPEAMLPRDMLSAFRKSAPKARTGCITCKIRRVKCDEEKPECKRCHTTGRKCDGYAPPKPIKRKKRMSKSQNPQYEAVVIHQAPVIRRSPSVDIRGDTAQRRSFHYFRSRNFTKLPGNFEPYFWNSVMLQFSHEYPTVQQSLVALSAIYESRSEGRGGGNQWQRHEHALRQYNKAVKTLVDYMSSRDQDPRVALISCLMFVWVELLQKNIEAGFQHLYSGMRILTSLRDSGTLKKKDSNEVERDDIYGSLSRSFTRLRIQVSIHGSTTDELAASCPLTDDSRYIPIPHTFTSIFESRICLDANFKIIFGYFRRLFDEHGADWENSPLSAVMLGYTRQEHMQRLQQWHSATKRMMDNSKNVEKDALGYAYLQVYYTLVHMCGEVLFENEMIYDKYQASFEKMLELSEVLLRNTRENALPLSFDMGVIPPLFFGAIKCRVYPLRMRALELLRLAPEQEGLWIRDSMVKFCEWKIPLEEAGRGNVPSTESLPESARIYRERLSLTDDGLRTCVKYRKGPYMVDGVVSEELVGYMEPLEWVGNMM